MTATHRNPVWNNTITQTTALITTAVLFVCFSFITSDCCMLNRISVDCETPGRCWRSSFQVPYLATKTASLYLNANCHFVCWRELVLACATQHPPHSYILHIYLAAASSHIANVPMRCLVFLSILRPPLILTPAKCPATLAATTCPPGTCQLFFIIIILVL